MLSMQFNEARRDGQDASVAYTGPQRLLKRKPVIRGETVPRRRGEMIETHCTLSVSLKLTGPKDGGEGAGLFFKTVAQLRWVIQGIHVDL